MKNFEKILLVIISIYTLCFAQEQYGGQAADAEWRQKAAERIETYRKGPLTVYVTNSNQQPVSNATVHINMQKHAFYFGSAVASSLIRGTWPDAIKYKKAVLELFNYVTLENALKWEAWDGYWGEEFDQENTMQALQWIEEHNLTQRGHAIVWHKPEMTGGESRDEIMGEVVDHVDDIVGYLAGYMRDWDVINEASHNSPVFNKIGYANGVEILKQVHELDPDARLFIHDAKILSQRNQGGQRHEDIHYNLASYIIEHEAPLHGISFQGHHGEQEWLTPIDKVLEILDRFSVFDKELQITEYDIKVAGTWNEPVSLTAEQELLEADYTRDFMTACFSHPKMTAFILWGFWDGHHWKYNAPLFRQDWTLKPSGQVWKNLVFNEWWTDSTMVTDQAGSVKLNAFYGDQKIIITKDGTVDSTQISILPGESISVYYDINTRSFSTEKKITSVQQNHQHQELKKKIPNQMSLEQNYPNPFNGQTTISFDSFKDQELVLDIYDILGKNFFHKKYNALTNSVINEKISTQSWPTGIYTYTLSTEKSEALSKKMLLVK